MKLNYKRTVLIGLSFMSILAFWQFYDQVIPYILESRFGLNTFKANAIMSIDNFLAIFMLPLFGIISDRTRTRLGKRTPYILFGTIAASLLMVFLAFMEESRHFAGFMAGLIALLVVMAIYRTPAVAYTPDVTPKPLRSKANAIINLVGYIGGIFSTVAMMFMLKSHKTADGGSVYNENQSFMPIFFVIAAFMLITVLIMVFTVNENKVVAECGVTDGEEESKLYNKGGKLPKPVFKSLILILMSVFFWYAAYNGVITNFSRYCINVWETDLSTSSSYLLAGTVAAILSFIPLGLLSSKAGRKFTILIGVAIITACYFAVMFIHSKTPVMYIIFALVGISWAAINVNSFPMVVEMSSGADVGKYTGFYYTFSMAAQIVTPLLSGFLIDHLKVGYGALFPYAVMLSLLSFVTMIFVKHGDSKPQKLKSVLENFDVGD